MKTCPKCNNDHEQKGKFCSKNCANSRGPRTNDFKNKVRLKLSGRKTSPEVIQKRLITQENNGSIRKPRICVICGGKVQKRETKTCSKECRSIMQREIAFKQLRHGGGKKGWYKGYHCDSTYELAYVVWHLDHNIHIEKCTEIRQYEYKNMICQYNPDFVVNGKIIEIKGYLSERAKAKLLYNKDICLLTKDDMKMYISYVKKKYNIKRVEELYENQPEYECKNCNSTFYTFRKSPIFCSRKCSGLYRCNERKNV